MERDFIEIMKLQIKLALLKKEDLKKKKAIRTLKLLEMSKGHGGSLTKKSLNKLNKLTEEELLAEISYLRATIAPDIRMKRRVKIGGKFKMVNFTINELTVSIKNAVKPENDIILSVVKLLVESFK